MYWKIEMRDDLEDLIDSVGKIADTSFGANLIAKRPSGSCVTGFYRPGERPDDGAPFTPTTTVLKYRGPQSGRVATEQEKRVSWPLQTEYLAGRLGKDAVENGKLWNTAKWMDLHHRIVAMPAGATQTINMELNTWKEVAAGEEIAEGFGVKIVGLSDNELKRFKLCADAYDIVRLMEELEELHKLSKLDANKLLREAGPRPIRADFPKPTDRIESGKIVRMLLLGLRSLYSPAKLAIVDHAEMYSLGMTQGVRRDIAPAVGRQRVIEGLRIADSIRKGLARQERGCNQTRAGQTRVRTAGLAAARRQASVDGIIKEVLAALPMPVRAPAGHYWNLAAGPVIKLADNDNRRADTVPIAA